MPLTPYRAFAPNQSQQYAAQTTMDPMQSPVARLRNSPALTAQFGYNPAEVDAKFQYGMAQQQFAAEKPFGMDALAERYGSYGNNIPSMRKNLMNLPTSRAQY